MQTSTDLFVANSTLSTSAHLFDTYLDDASPSAFLLKSVETVAWIFEFPSRKSPSNGLNQSTVIL